MSETAVLSLKVVSDQVVLATNRLDELEKKSGKVERATDGLSAGFGRMLAPVLASVSAIGALTKIVDTTREFDKLNAGLITATGSTDGAKEAFKALQQYATNTPYQLKEVTGAFISLVNRGLDPSERALTSYGNIASSTTGTIQDFVLAVANSTKGEFENLKKYGIGAQKEGNNVAFTFRGVTTTVKNTTRAIERYMIKLGENNFAGSMATRMDTLDGAISNLGDAWDKLALTVSESGIGDYIKYAVKRATDALEELSNMVASGQMAGYLEALGIKFSGWGNDVKTAISDVSNFWASNLFGMKDKGEGAVDFIIDAFKNLPENVKAFIEILVIEVASTFDTIGAYSKYFVDAIKAIFTDKTIEEAGRDFVANLNRIEYAEKSSIEETLRNREVTIKAAKDKIKAADELRAAYDKQQKAEAEANKGKDRLGKFGKGTKENPVDKAEQKRAAAARKSMEEALATEEEKIWESYDKRQKIIETYNDDKKREKLSAANLAKFDAERAALREKNGKELAEIEDGLKTQEQVIEESYARRALIVALNVKDPEKASGIVSKLAEERATKLKEIEDTKAQEREKLEEEFLTEEAQLLRAQERKRKLILDSEALTAEQRKRLLAQLEEKNSQELFELHTRYAAETLQASQNLFTGLADLAKGYGGEQSKTYQALFRASKGFALAQAGLSIATGIAEALKLGWPAGIAAGIQVATVGAGALATISGSSYSGAYDKGGIAPPGKLALVGENGPELIKGGATVVSRKETADAFKRSQSQSNAAPQPMIVKVVNGFSSTAVTNHLSVGTPGEKAIMNVIESNGSAIREIAATPLGRRY